MECHRATIRHLLKETWISGHSRYTYSPYLSTARPHATLSVVELKKAASGVLAPWPGSQTPPYAPPNQGAAALLDEPF